MLTEIKHNLPIESINYSDGSFKLIPAAFEECKKYNAEVIGAFILWITHAQKAFKCDDDQVSSLVDVCSQLPKRRFKGTHAKLAWNVYLIGLKHVGDENWFDVLGSAYTLYHNLTTEVECDASS